MRNYKEIAFRYAEDVISEKILANKNIKACCKRFIDFSNRDDMFMDDNELSDVCALIECMTHANNKPFILEDWQVFFFAGIYLYKWKKTKKRVTRTVYLTVSRKNGKSAMIGALANAGLLLHPIHDSEDPKEAEVLVLANSSEQAQILFDFSNGMANRLDPDGEMLEPYRKEVRHKHTGGAIRVKASDPTKLDGYGPNLFVIDELHEAKDSRIYDVMVSGQGARRQPLEVLITTRGFNSLSFCKEFEDNAIDTMKGIVDNPSVFAMVFCLDEEDDWKDSSNDKKSNPNLGITVHEEYLESERKKAIDYGSTYEVNFKVKNCNIWQNTADVWVRDEVIDDAMRHIDFEDFRGQDCYIGVDLSSVQDLTAVSWLFEKDGKYSFINRAFLPEDNLRIRKNAHMWEKWHNEGFLLTTQGNVVDYDEITNYINWVRDEYDINVIAILYDRYNATQWAIKCDEEGYDMVEHPQNFGAMNSPMKAVEMEIIKGNLYMDASPLTKYNFRCVVPKFDPQGINKKPTKASKYHKIDICVAMIQAMGGWLFDNGGGQPNMY